MILEVFNFIISGTLITLGVSLIALPLGFCVGLVFAVLRVFGGKKIAFLISIYSSGMRGVPVVVLLFILYFVISGTVNLTPFWAGSISLGIVSSAYQLEILRGAVQAVGGGQMVAARAIGMTKMQAVRYIIIPQALRLAIPPWANEASCVIKDSSLVYALGVAEILRRAQQMAAATYQPFLAFSMAALIYFFLVLATSRLLGWVEQKTQIPGFSYNS